MNAKQWASLPKPTRKRSIACAEANVNMLARYDARNTEALRKLVERAARSCALSRAR